MPDRPAPHEDQTLIEVVKRELLAEDALLHEAEADSWARDLLSGRWEAWESTATPRDEVVRAIVDASACVTRDLIARELEGLPPMVHFRNGQATANYLNRADVLAIVTGENK